MADINYNVASGGDYTPQVGDRYEISPGNWGIMPAPTLGLQNRLAAMAEEEASDIKMARAILVGTQGFDDDDAIFGMAQAVVLDFFTLVQKIADRLTSGFGLSNPPNQETKA